MVLPHSTQTVATRKLAMAGAIYIKTGMTAPSSMNATLRAAAMPQ